MISRWTTDDREAVFDLILPIQQQEFGVPVTRADQSDLEQADAFYVAPGGLWCARDNGRIIGTIALKAFGEGQGALRKMFVAADYRGKEHGVAAGLLAHLVDQARQAGIRQIYLGTVGLLQAALRFYEKNGFVRIEADGLPEGFPRMPVDHIFYRLDVVI